MDNDLGNKLKFLNDKKMKMHILINYTNNEMDFDEADILRNSIFFELPKGLIVQMKSIHLV